MENQDLLEQLQRTVKAFIYSWMRPGFCETLEEVMYSKALLQALLSSVAVKSIFSSSAANECPTQKLCHGSMGTLSLWNLITFISTKNGAVISTLI